MGQLLQLAITASLVKWRVSGLGGSSKPAGDGVKMPDLCVDMVFIRAQKVHVRCLLGGTAVDSWACTDSLKQALACDELFIVHH